MQTFRIRITGAYMGTADVKASAPDVAIKRLLGGGHQAGFKFATVGPNRVKLAKGQTLSISVERIG